MPVEPHGTTIPAEFVSFADVFAALWERRWLIASVTLALTVAAGVGAFVVQKRYDASVVIAPISEEAGAGRLGGGLGALVSQFGGFASAAGLSVSGNDRKNESLAILRSESLTTQFIEQNNLLPVLYADKWDAGHQRWSIDNAGKVPTLWKASEYFRKSLRNLTTDTKTGLSTLTVSWTDPVIAADWANRLVAMANDAIRNRTIKEAERNVAYLNEQVEKTNVVPVQNAISALLEDEIKKIMIARGNNEYAFKVIDPAVAPERPSFPSKMTWVVGGAVLGLVLSCGLVLTGLVARA
jgi:uncharacterized protein involved in exopolysaccharide biosynthesis